MKEVYVRSISGLLFTAIIVGGILLCSASFAIIFGIITMLMIYEYISICAPYNNQKGQKIYTMIIGLSVFLSVFFVCGGYAGKNILAIPVLMILISFVKNIFIKRYNKHQIEYREKSIIREPNGYEIFPIHISAIVYIALPLSLLNIFVFGNNFYISELSINMNVFDVVPEPTYSGKLLLSFFIILWASDVGAYCFGSTLGQKFGPKLFPSVSPKKSWIGFIGGLICAVTAGIILNRLGLLELRLNDSIILSVILCIGGVLGDLVESQLKRNFGIKDSGHIIPGHGGMLDRFDSMLIAFPLAFVYIELFLHY